MLLARICIPKPFPLGHPSSAPMAGDQYAALLLSDVNCVTLNLKSAPSSDVGNIPVSIHCVPVDSRYSTYASYGRSGSGIGISTRLLPTSMLVPDEPPRSNFFFRTRKDDIVNSSPSLCLRKRHYVQPRLHHGPVIVIRVELEAFV